MDNMEAYIAQQVMDAFDGVVATEDPEATMAARILAGQTKYNAWFGTATKRRIYGKYIPMVNMLLETTTSEVTTTDYSECIVVYTA